MKPLHSYMQENIVMNESIKYTDYQDLQSKCKDVYEKVGKLIVPVRQEFEKLQAKKDAMEKLYNLVYDINYRIESFGAFVAIAEKAPEKYSKDNIKDQIKMNTERIDAGFAKYKSLHINDSDVTKQMKTLDEIYQAVKDRANAL